MLRKFPIFMLFIVAIIGLAGCGGAKEKASTGSGEGDMISVSIESASYILAGDDGISENDNTGLLAVNLEVKNKTKSAIYVSPYDGVNLYDGEEQLSPQNDVYNSKVGLESRDSGDVGPEKMRKMTVIFYVEKDKQYEIGIKPMPMGEDEPDEVIIPLDTTQYTDSFERLNEPALALSAYIDTIYFNKENVDYEKYVTADKAALVDEAKGLFTDRLEGTFSNGVPAEEIDKHYASYQSLLAQKAEFNTVTTAHANGKAVVKVEYSTIPLRELYNPVGDYRKEFRDNTGVYDSKQAEAYALSKLDTILHSLEPKKSQKALEVIMIEKDGKWTVDASYWGSEALVQAFSEGRL